MKLNLQPIRLISGSHPDMVTTGQGCFMNIISYLNGESQITDESPCVCVTIRPMVIWFNDYLTSSERECLIPYIERAMGSATQNKNELARRVRLWGYFVNECHGLVMKITSESFQNNELFADARSAAKTAASAVSLSRHFIKIPSWLLRKDFIDLVLFYLDKILPKEVEIPPVVVSRAKDLVDLVRD